MISNMYNLYCFVLVLCATLVTAQNIYKTVSLNRTLTFDDKELYADFVYLNRSSTLQVNFTDPGKSLSFIIFQAHSHLFSITMYKNENLIENHVNGMNLGLHSTISKTLDTFYVFNPSDTVDLKLFIAVYGYKESDPIPGGCNMEFPIPISPFMRATAYNKTYIILEAPPPQVLSDTRCLQLDNTDLRTEFYMLYLPERNYDADVYFESIRNMATLKNNRIYSRIIANSSEKYWNMRRMLSAYPGTGAIYVAVSYIGPPTNFSSYSIYVPTHSYACSPLIESDCELLEDSLTMFLSATIFFLGIAMCYFGHHFFKTQILTIGFLSGSVVTYIILSLMFEIGGPAALTASALSGLCVGAVRLVCWWLYGIPVFVIVMSSADVGFLVASLFYYSMPVPVTYLQVDFNFWSLFILIMLIITICLVSLSYIANLISCAVIGAYTAIYPIDYYMGSNLKYILNNTIRRATVYDFNKAVIIPTFQWRDTLLCFVWLVLAVTGFTYQYYANKGRPPFPPPPRSIRAVPEDPAEPTMVEPSRYYRNPYNPTEHSIYTDERTPLLS